MISRYQNRRIISTTTYPPRLSNATDTQTIHFTAVYSTPPPAPTIFNPSLFTPRSAPLTVAPPRLVPPPPALPPMLAYAIQYRFGCQATQGTAAPTGVVGMVATVSAVSTCACFLGVRLVGLSVFVRCAWVLEWGVLEWVFGFVGLGALFVVCFPFPFFFSFFFIFSVGHFVFRISLREGSPMDIRETKDGGKETLHQRSEGWEKGNEMRVELTTHKPFTLLPLPPSGSSPPAHR